MTTRPLLRSSSSSVGVSAAVSVDSVTISRKWYRKPHSEHHAVRQGEHSILQGVQLARRRHRARREGTPVETLSNLARAAPCSTRQPRLPSPQSLLVARASTTKRTQSTRASAGTICPARTAVHAGREHTNSLDHAAARRVGGDCTGDRQHHPRARFGMLACVLMAVLRRMEAVLEASMASELDQDAAPGAVSVSVYNLPV